ncbi:MAG TPA: DUF4097 family beta strand repeat-containing protein [Trueperaceae bacterium]|nr:DUF4097 family beta strand repeat-containing protein [Trueperaceae bacterium]
MDSHPTPLRIRRRRLAARVAAAATVAAVTALAVGVAFAASDKRDLDLSAVRHVDATTVSGRIAVTIDPGASGVTVEHRGNVGYDVAVQGDTLLLRGRNRSLLCIDCEVSFDVRLPGPAALQLRTTNGNISVTGAMARVDAATTNGDVTASGTADAPLDLASTNGRVAVTGARAELRIRNTNGSVEIADLTLPAGSASRAQSVNGSITVRGLASPAALEITGNVSNGGVTVSLDNAAVTYPGSGHGRSFRATTDGEGYASLDLRTVNGSLTVRR